MSSLTPVRVLGSCSFLYMRASDVYILAVTKSNANAMLAFQFMTDVRPGPDSRQRVASVRCAASVESLGRPVW